MRSLFSCQLYRLGACYEAIKWVGDKEFEEAWASCEDMDWMFWLAEKLKVDSKLSIQAACRCARLVLHLVLKGEERPKRAVETIEAWLEGRASIEEIQAASEAAWIASCAATRAACVTCAVEAAKAVCDAVWVTVRTPKVAAWVAARDTARAAKAAARAAETVCDSSIKPQILSIIREVLTQPVREKLSKINP